MKKKWMFAALAAALGVSTLSGAVVTSWSKAPDENGKLVFGGLRTNGMGSRACITAIPATISFQITVKEKVKSAWCTAGINLFLGNKEWMQIALHEMRGKRTLELTVTKDGKYNAKDGLGTKEIITDGSWEYGKPYTVTAEITATAIHLRMVDADGKTVIAQKIPVTELPKAATSGKLTLRVCYAMAEFGTVNLE